LTGQSGRGSSIHRYIYQLDRPVGWKCVLNSINNCVNGPHDRDCILLTPGVSLITRTATVWLFFLMCRPRQIQEASNTGLVSCVCNTATHRPLRPYLDAPCKFFERESFHI
jgi:hypothetical protein